MAERLFELRRTTFDTPHFRGIEFIEVEAKTVINHVPGTYLPFNWTINPYRGCSHGCSYCLAGDTPIFMADGRQRPLRDVRVGDVVYGVERRGAYLRYVPTEVLDHWQTIKPAYMIVLEDGTRLVASADHRFLSNRGWKFVTGREQGPDQRPHLTLNNSLMGTGHFAAGPKFDDDYRIGYLCGLIRGDGHLGSYSYVRPGRTLGDVHRFRLALKDLEPLNRARKYLADFGVLTQEFAFSPAVGTHAAITAIRTSKRANIESIGAIISWPEEATDEWCRGFLGGIFDAEGSYNRGIMRIANCDRSIIDRIEQCMRRFGFTFVLELKVNKSSTNVRLPVTVVRLLGGLQEHLRFFHTVEPATTRKRTIHGQAVKSKSRLNISKIEELGIEMPLYDITTGTGNFIADGVVSHNCFARSTHTFLDMNAGVDFETKIVVKVNAPDVLRRQLRAKRWKGEHIAMGTATDPYQRAEGRYKLMTGIISTLTEYRNPFSILTKGTLILRDLDLLIAAAEVTDVATAFSIGTLDEDAWRISEPGTPHPRKRMEAVAKLNAAGIPCGVMVAPILPGISDGIEQLREVVRAAADAGATHITPILLHLRPKVKEVYMDWLQSAYPEFVTRYEAMYGRSSYAAQGTRDAVTSQVRELVAEMPVRPRGAPRRGQRAEGRTAPVRDQASQLTLL
ncbi:MAG: intein-containing Rv2578c family radical SAM protein [Actinomycetota bacterium]|nr:intein-containing Rv2578c family radical SAM protein [Actinomycetota bacterium]